MDSGRWPGGSIKVRDIIEDHGSEIAFDFRKFFGVSYLEIGRSITYKEAAQLIAILIKDPSSWICAKLVDWKHPVSEEWMVLANIYDLTALVNSRKKPKPYPRPWKNHDSTKIGKKGQSRKSVIERLRQMNNRESGD